MTDPVPRPKIVVVGSLNIDHFAYVARLPRPGETVAGHRTLTRFGGKGANQAVAAARCGGDVSLVGRVGDDAPGTRYLEALRAEGIDVSGVAACRRGEPTGSAFIAVEDGGENAIIVNAGANGSLAPEDIECCRESIAGADLLLLQLEVPMAAVEAAARIAAEAGVTAVLNPSPMVEGIGWERLPVSVVIVNETEHESLPADLDARVIITRGSGTTSLRERDGRVIESPAFAVEAVDTVVAGDSFAGAVATVLASGLPAAEALRFANAAGALATLGQGAQEAIPDRAAIERFLSQP